MYIIRLDDASEYMDVKKWDRIENLLDKYSIKPLVGVIPNNNDPSMVNYYVKNKYFWEKVKRWQNKGWEIALHGYSHVYTTKQGGVNPVNFESEFAGVPLNKQIEKIKKGINIFEEHNINTEVFFAPSHTFDLNTLEALRVSSNIRIISDTISNDVYKKEGFYFIPQQSGKVRRLPFKLTTFCYHPNSMKNEDFVLLESFLKKNSHKFTRVKDIHLKNRSLSFYDKLLNNTYFTFRNIRKIFTRKNY